MTRKEQKKYIFTFGWHYLLELGLCASLALSGYAWLYLLISLFCMVVVVGANSSIK